MNTTVLVKSSGLWRLISAKLELASRVVAVITVLSIPISTSVTDIGFLLAVVLNLLAGQWKEKFSAIFSSKVALLFLLLFVLFVAGTFYSSAPGHDITGSLLRYSKFLVAIFYLPIFSEKKWRNYAINAFIFAALVTLFLSFLQYLDLFYYRHAANDSVFKDYIETSFIMVFATFLVLMRLQEASKYRWVYWVLLAVMSFHILFLNHGRTGYIIYFSLLLLAAWQQWRWKGFAIGCIVSVVLMGAMFLSSSTVQMRVHRAVQDVSVYDKGETNTSLGLRFEFWKGALRVVQQHPVFGAGTGALQTELSRLQPPVPHLTNNPHNEYLSVAAQVGLLGLCVLLAIFYAAWKASLTLNPAMRRILQAVIVVIMIGSLANSWLLDTTEGHTFVLFVILALASTVNLNSNAGKSHEN
jgi:O-antigen ligase